MLSSEIAAQSKHFPTGFRRDFDAHVYYSTGKRNQAESLRDLAAQDFDGFPVFVGKLRDRSVGPHPQPMFELNFPRELLGQMLLWLMYERKGLTVLVHEVTGNDPRDHSEGAIWLGEPVTLDESKFDPAPVKGTHDESRPVWFLREAASPAKSALLRNASSRKTRARADNRR